MKVTKSTDERIKVLREIITKAESELTKATDSMSIAYYKLTIRKAKGNIERVESQKELEKMGDYFEKMKAQAKIDKKKDNAMLRIQKKVDSIKKIYNEECGVVATVEIKTVANNHHPAVPVKV